MYYFKRGSARIPDIMAGEKILIFDLILSKERPHKVTTKPKILAWSDNPLLSLKYLSIGGSIDLAKKWTFFALLICHKSFPLFRALTYWWHLKKEREFFFLSDHPFWDFINITMWTSKGQQSIFLTKNSLNFSIFFK